MRLVNGDSTNADELLCSSCKVTLSRDDYNAHLSMCVGDERSTRKFVEQLHSPPAPRVPLEQRPGFVAGAVIACGALLVGNLLLLASFLVGGSS